MKRVRPLFSNGHWMFSEQLDPSKYLGFVYIIKDLRTGKMYIGKKQMVGTGRLNKGKESDWCSYTGSCDALNKEISNRGIYEFLPIVLEQYMTKGTLSFAESWSLTIAEAPYNRLFYNTLIEKVSWRCSEPISVRHRSRLAAVLAGDTPNDSVI